MTHDIEHDQSCAECGRAASWIDNNSDPPKVYCDEHVVQDAHVRLADVGARADEPPRVKSVLWRVGRKLGRTIYCGDRLVGLVDTDADARAIVDAMNRRDD